MAIIRNRSLIPDPDNINPVLLQYCIQEHIQGNERLDKLDRYYKGKHAILERNNGAALGMPNNKLVINHAKLISENATSYMLGSAVQYNGDSNLEAIKDILKKNDVVSHDMELGKDLSVFGEARELYYVSADANDNVIPKATVIDPRECFLVVDDTVDYKSIFGCRYYPVRDMQNVIKYHIVEIYTDNNVHTYECKDINSASFTLKESVPHYFKKVPLVEYWNNEYRTGDFEDVISLIDGYNVLQSDRVNSQEQFADAILKVKGFNFGSNEEEVSESVKLLKQFKIMSLQGEDAAADWLIKTNDESKIEVLRKSIANDIHQMSGIPNLTDENFAGNSSGVAMEFKLLGLEWKVAEKARYFTQGLRERLQLFSNFLGVKAQKRIDVSEVEIIINRSLPSNLVEIADLIDKLVDKVSDETLLSLLHFVTDPKAEIERVRKQKDEAVKRQQAANVLSMPFGDMNQDNNNPNNDPNPNPNDPANIDNNKQAV